MATKDELLDCVIHRDRFIFDCVIRRHPFNVVERMDYDSRSKETTEMDRGL